MEKKHLPVGIQYFPDLIHRGFLYVDKTKLILQMIQESFGTFLARPRRFGKSLLVTTLESIFLGDKDLFKDTWIATSDYNWEYHPVIRLDGTKWVSNSDEDLNRTIHSSLKLIAKKYDIELEIEPYAQETFTTFIYNLYEKLGKVVILVDEYDHPIVSQLNNPQRLEKTIDFLGHFYRVMKTESEFIHSVFVTGVSKFAKVSLFSGMNNLDDISLNPHYNTLVGITESEIEHYYLPYIKELAEKQNCSISDLRSAVKKWYNGYLFGRPPEANETVYNPVSLHNFLRRGQFANFWFGTATPTFALNLLKSQNYPIPNLEDGVAIGMKLEERHKTDKIELIPLLYQTGYLTITDYDNEEKTYHLAFPNTEVKESFLNHLFESMTELEEGVLDPHYEKLYRSLKEGNIDSFIQAFNTILTHIPYPLHIADEAYYHSILFIILRALGIRSSAEVTTYRGRLDLLIEFSDRAYVIECKINSTAKKAMDQILSRKYHAHLNQKVTLIGLNFDTETKQITDWTHSLY